MLSMLALSVGAAFGWRSMCAFFARGTSTRTVWLRSWLLVGIIILDYWTFTVFPSSDAQNIPTFYRTISADNQSYSIIDIPLPHQDFSRPLYYQTIHRKKMFGGYLSRTPDEAIKFVTSQPFLDFAKDGRLSISDNEALNAAEIIRRFNVRYLIFHRGYLSPASSKMLTSWAQQYFHDPVFTDKSIIVYSVPVDIASATIAGLNQVIPPQLLPIHQFRSKTSGKVIVSHLHNELMKEWILWENGSVRQEFKITQAGLYNFSLVARGTPALNMYPSLTIALNEVIMGRCSVKDTLQKVGTWSVELNPGLYTLSIQYTNDLYKPPEDRNVMLFAVSIIPQRLTKE